MKTEISSHSHEIMEAVLDWQYSAYEENKKYTCNFGWQPLRKWSFGRPGDGMTTLTF
jgi:hypothetical protein